MAVRKSCKHGFHNYNIYNRTVSSALHYTISLVPTVLPTAVLSAAYQTTKNSFFVRLF